MRRKKIPRRTTRRRGIGRLTMCSRGDCTPQDISQALNCQEIFQTFLNLFSKKKLPSCRSSNTFRSCPILNKSRNKEF